MKRPSSKQKPQKSARQALICNECGQQFDMLPQIETLEDGGEEHYFACPRCGHRYVTARISARGVEIRETVRQLRNELGALPKNATRQRDRLRNQIEGWVWELEGEIVGAA